MADCNIDMFDRNVDIMCCKFDTISFISGMLPYKKMIYFVAEMFYLMYSTKYCMPDLLSCTVDTICSIHMPTGFDIMHCMVDVVVCSAWFD